MPNFITVPHYRLQFGQPVKQEEEALVNPYRIAFIKPYNPGVGEYQPQAPSLVEIGLDFNPAVTGCSSILTDLSVAEILRRLNTSSYTGA